MHALAEAMHAAGITVYVPDIRGHGGSGRRGDIDYVGQIDDDLADFVSQLGLVSSEETRTLVGFSAGAGFSIRFAGGPYGGLFDSYVFLAPILPGAPTLRANGGGWTSIALARIMTIGWFNRLGIHWFDGFPVIRYAISPENARSMTGSYSFRLSSNFGAGRPACNLSEQHPSAGGNTRWRCRRAGGRGPIRSPVAAPWPDDSRHRRAEYES
jgi:pimeloyl-ACP methyl ester carboxylesterase